MGVLSIPYQIPPHFETLANSLTSVAYILFAFQQINSPFGILEGLHCFLLEMEIPGYSRIFLERGFASLLGP